MTSPAAKPALDNQPWMAFAASVEPCSWVVLISTRVFSMSRASSWSAGGGTLDAGDAPTVTATASPMENAHPFIANSPYVRLTASIADAGDKPIMNSGRLEAFSDGVIAIIITIMVLELKVPHGATADALLPLIPAFLSYVLSFIYVGIYWNNHHHLLHTCERVNGAILWANLHLLFWLSLFPVTTAWIGENHLAAQPSALYGAVLLMAAVAYWMLQAAIIGSQGP